MDSFENQARDMASLVPDGAGIEDLRKLLAHAKAADDEELFLYITCLLEENLNSTDKIIEDPFAFSIPHCDSEAVKKSLTHGEQAAEPVEAEEQPSDGPTAMPWGNVPYTAPKRTPHTQCHKASDAVTDEEPGGDDLGRTEKTPRGTSSTHPVSPGNAGSLGSLVAEFCCGLKGLLHASKKPVSTEACGTFSPMPKNIFDAKVAGLLERWSSRRERFEQAWSDLQKNQLSIEAGVDRIRDNPLVLRAMDEMLRTENNPSEQKMIRAELCKDMNDTYSEYAGSLRRDYSDIAQELKNFKTNAKIAIDASIKEPLDRFACPEALHKNLTSFYSEVLVRPELSLICDQQNNETLSDKITAILHDIDECFENVKRSLSRYFTTKEIDITSDAPHDRHKQPK